MGVYWFWKMTNSIPWIPYLSVCNISWLEVWKSIRKEIIHYRRLYHLHSVQHMFINKQYKHVNDIGKGFTTYRLKW